KEKLGRSDLQIEVKSLASDSLPGFVLINEQERRMRDYMALHQAEKAHHFKPQKTLVLNTNSPLIQSLDSLDSKDPLLAKEILEQVFYLSLLSQKELQGEEVGVFVKQQSMLLEKLTSRL
ncbi:MAG: molecular chaperone HtpG, partial [Chlamydiota bacterium]